MSTATRMPLVQAIAIADGVRQALAPFCARIEIAGSIRRQRSTVGDIEVVCMPRQVPGGLFGDELGVDPGFCTVVNEWPAENGQPTGKHTKRVLPGGTMLNLYMANADNWGLIYVIRTGSAAYTKWLLGTLVPRRGYRSREGQLIRRSDGQVVPIWEEADLFALLGLPYPEPSAREV